MIQFTVRAGHKTQHVVNNKVHAFAYAYANANAGDRDKFLRAAADSVEAALRACNAPGIALLDQLLPVNS